MEGNRIPGRVLMTADTVGGVWTYALELTRALGTHGVQVALATMGGLLTPEQWSEARAMENVHVFESDFRLEWMDDPWNDVERAGDWLLEIESEFEPDLIHLNNYAHGTLPWSAPIVVVGHSCVLSWWAAVKNTPLPEAWSKYHDAVLAGLQAANVVVAPSYAMLDALERYYGPFSSAAVIPNGRLCPTANHGGCYKENFILAAGRLWDEAKNIRALAEAANRLPWPVCVAGDSRHPNGVPAHFDNVQLLGRLGSGAMCDWFERASIYALPARYEPFGLSALEAAAAGCALVLGDIGSLREIWGEAALFVRPDDHDGLASTLLALIEDTDLRTEYAERARLHSQQFTTARMMEGYLAVYAEVLEREQTPREKVCA